MVNMSSQEESATASIDDDAELLALERILSEADEKENAAEKEELTPPVEAAGPSLRYDHSFVEIFSYELDLSNERRMDKVPGNAAKDEDLDSSDDEEVKNFLERKYNEYGCDINKRLKQQRAAEHDEKVTREVNEALGSHRNDQESYNASFRIKNPHNPVKRQSLVKDSLDKPARPQESCQPARSTNCSTPLEAQSSGFTDPVFGLRIINPLVSSALLLERMSGRKSVPFSGIAFHTQRGDLAKDWVIAGVIVSKSPVRMSKRNEPFSVWRLSDLRGEIKTISLFLFKRAHKDLWKTAEGMCIAVLNPNVFEKRAESNDVACLSIDTAQKVMVLGQSKDLGACKARKRNGEACNAVVNLSECDTCVFHVKQEFSKMSRRSELQSANAGRGLNDLRNKVLGKSEVFYGGQSFTAVPAKKSAKLASKDMQRMSSLSEYAVSPFAGSVNHSSKPKARSAAVPYAAREGPLSKVASNVESSAKQRLKDLERLKVLQTEPVEETTVGTEATVQKSPATQSPSNNANSSILDTSSSAISPLAASVPDKFRNRQFSFAGRSPQLSRENFSIEVNVNDRRTQLSKLKAIQILKQRPIEKVNPNSIRGSKEGKRRAIDELNEKYAATNEAKRQKLEDEQHEAERKTRIERIMEACSSHKNLIDMRQREDQDKYFSKLEKKEALEEKMLNTYKVPCKAVICKECKYTAFSAAQRCKEEQHVLKVVDAEKRFFQCKDCGSRTVTVFKLPKISCQKCRGSRWERASMIRERKVLHGSEVLSVRGDEETFLGSLAGKTNLNLLVPDD